MRKLRIIVIIILILVLIVMLLIKILASGWSVKSKEKAINIPLNSNVISEIDTQIRGMEELENKNVYLNEITLKAEAKGQTVDDM